MPATGGHRMAVTGDVIVVECRECLVDRDDLAPLSGGGTERDEIASRKLTCRRTDHRSTATSRLDR
jgi:hypothetical protein